MAGNKIAGVDVLLSIKEGAGTAQVLGGQSGATISRSTNVIETTSKENGAWAESVAGVRSWSMEVEGFIVTNDAAYSSLEEAWLNNTTLTADIAFPGGKKYTGTVIIAELSTDAAQDDAVTYSLSLTGTGALTATPGTTMAARKK